MAAWRRWLQRVWTLDGLAAAVEVASPVLACRVGEVCAGRERRARQVAAGKVVSVVRYLLRMTSRATPFGLCAGVAPVRLGSGPVARGGAVPRAVARIDSVWLAGVITRLEGCPQLRGAGCRSVLNNLCFVRDERLVVGCQQLPAAPSRTAPAEVSVRHSRAVEAVTYATRSPISVADLTATLRSQFPATAESVIEAMLAELVAQRILITSLRPPMTATDPLAWVVGELSTVGADTMPTVAELFGQLREIHADLCRHNGLSSPAVARGWRTSATRRVAAISTTERSLTVDLLLDYALILPHAVAREAETAAAVLTRLTPCPHGPPAWRDYHSRFLQRYGIGALVPVLEILNADTGLGFPAGYRDSHVGNCLSRRCPSGICVYWSWRAERRIGREHRSRSR